MRLRTLSLVAILGVVEVGGLSISSVDGTIRLAEAQRRPRRRRPAKAPAKAPAPAPAPEAAPAAPEPSAEPGTAHPPGNGPGAGGPAAAQQPPPMEGGAPAEEPPPEGPTIPQPTPLEDIGALEDEYHALVDEVFQARTRVAALGAQLYSTKVLVRVQDRTDRAQALQRIRLTLDGDPIFSGDSSFRAPDGRRVYDGFAAPGLHALGVEAEYRSRENDRYVYRLGDSYTFEVVKGRVTEVRILLEEDSNIAEDFPDDREGEWDVRSRIRVEAIE